MHIVLGHNDLYLPGFEFTYIIVQTGFKWSSSHAFFLIFSILTGPAGQESPIVRSAFQGLFWNRLWIFTSICASCPVLRPQTIWALHRNCNAVIHYNMVIQMQTALRVAHKFQVSIYSDSILSYPHAWHNHWNHGYSGAHCTLGHSQARVNQKHKTNAMHSPKSFKGILYPISDNKLDVTVVTTTMLPTHHGFLCSL